MNRFAVVDLETLSLRPDAAILSIGAVVVTEQLTLLDDQFYVSITNPTGRRDEATQVWWTQQSEDARAALRVNLVDHTSAIQQFAAFLERNQVQHVMGCGPRVDNAWLDNAYYLAGIETPWPFWGDLDMRTLRFIRPGVEADPFMGTKHHAHHDAYNEALHAIKILKTL